MNKGLYLVKEILKTVQLQSTSYSQVDSQEQLSVKSPTSSATIELPSEKRLVLVKKERNIYKRVFKLYPQLQTGHIYRLFGFMAINERSLIDQNFEESYFSTYFNGRVVKKVQYYDHAIVIEMSPAYIPPNQPPVDYFIERIQAKSDKLLFQLAKQIGQVYEQFKTMPRGQNPDQKNQSVKKCLDNLGNSMFVCTLGINKVAVSKSLLQYLEYDLEEFGIEAIKYKTIFHEFFSAINYSTNVLHLVKNLKHTAQLFQNKMTLTQFFKSTSLKFTDYIYSKSGVKSFCEMSFCMLNPTFFCHKIDFIYYKDNQANNNELGVSQLRLAIEGEQERMRQQQYSLIKRVKTIPSHMLKENQRFISGYKELDNVSQPVDQVSQ